MNWIYFVVGAMLNWGLYGPILHKGQVALGNPLRAMLCVGVAYFLVGVLAPVVMLGSSGQLNGFNQGGTLAALAGGALGAVGALCIVMAFRAGGLPIYVMPLVIGGAPVVNVLFSLTLHPPKSPINPMLYLGFLFAALGGGLVLYYKPAN